jgi:hypothetical protein
MPAINPTAVDVEYVRTPKVQELRRRTPLSLRPDARLMIAAAEGNEYAIAVRDAWKPNYKVTLMEPDEFERQLREREVVYVGR